VAKKIKFESFRYRFLIAARDAAIAMPAEQRGRWEELVRTLDFSYRGGVVKLAWHLAPPGSVDFLVADACLYRRGPHDRIGDDCLDPVRDANEVFFVNCVERVLLAAGFVKRAESFRFEGERTFHDAWAKSEDIDQIDVRRMNEACTAPEMRCIVERLGELRGKRVLDVGCGLGEASVYFAMLGADVTATDLSAGMLEATARLAVRNNVSVRTHLSAAEDLRLSEYAVFDVIYAGNLLHHVDIATTLKRLSRHLAEGGIFVSWDPLAYNPVINVYRRLATAVRTPDEHPLTWADIRGLRAQFERVETRYFWLTSLAVFLIMAIIQRRDPSKERYWKAVVREEASWRKIYLPLAALDRCLLALLPPLRLLCWNVVVFASGTLASGPTPPDGDRE
jgi:SAM-dependent methyltransferase